MPLMYGIAALAVFANGVDQTGIDPQIDKQYAIVKRGQEPKPPLAPEAEVAAPARATEDHVAPASSPKTVAGYPSKPAIGGLRVTTDAQQSIEVGGKIVNIAQGSASDELTVEIGGKLVKVPNNLASASSAFPQFGSRAEAPRSVAYFSGDNLSRLKGMDRTVSVQFNNASAGDVIKWLSKQNVNFVANVDTLPKSKITVNLYNVPLHEALETVAESLGGSWQVRGTTLIFKTGSLGSLRYAPARIGSTNGFELMPFGEMKSLKPMNEEQMRAFEKSAGDLRKQMESFKFDMKAMPKMDMKAFEELKSLKGLNKDGKSFEFKTIDPKAFEELKSLHGLAKVGPDFKLKSLSDFKGFKGMTFKKVDSEKFMNSLSKAQKDLMKKQGHLKFSDLTEAQRAMLFEGSTKELPKDFTFMFSRNGEKIVIKN